MKQVTEPWQLLCQQFDSCVTTESALFTCFMLYSPVQGHGNGYFQTSSFGNMFPVELFGERNEKNAASFIKGNSQWYIYPFKIVLSFRKKSQSCAAVKV